MCSSPSSSIASPPLIIASTLIASLFPLHPFAVSAISPPP